jgi:hypothetical protein
MSEPIDIELPDGTHIEADVGDDEIEVDGLGVVVLHPIQGPSRLIERFQKPAYLAVLRAVCEELQEAENALWSVLLSRYIDNAEGVSLNYLGSRVGEPRASLNDPDYRVRIKARILINRSRGRAEDLLGIVRALGLHAVVRNTHRASMRLEVTTRPTNVSTRRQIASLLGEATSGGVRLFVSMPTATSPRFRLGFRGGPTSYGGKLSSVSATIADAGHLTDGRIT